MKLSASGRCLFLVLGVVLGASNLARAQEDYRVVKAFGPTSRSPYTGMIKATDGNFYGGTLDGIYRLTPDGVYTLITPPGLSIWTGDPIQASDGNLYAATNTAVVRVSLDGAVTILHTLHDSFLEGFFTGPLVEGDDGQFYGFTRLNGAFHLGTVFRISDTGVFTTLRSMNPSEGPTDYTRIIKGRDGSFYGNMGAGGVGAGTLFRMSSDGTVTTLHVFTGGTGGAFPRSGLVEASDGNFYGTTDTGGAYGVGTIFRMCPDGSFAVLYSIAGTGAGGDGISKMTNPLVEGSDGTLYGTGEYSIFRMTKAGEVRLLHTTLNTYPSLAAIRRYGWGFVGALVEGRDGNLFGAVAAGGPGDSGALFQLNRKRSACANVLDLSWNGDTGTLTLIGALKSETPALIAGLFVSFHGLTPLWLRLTPAITPTAVFELPIPLTSMGLVGVYTLVVTSNGHLCTDWTTADTGGTGPSADDLGRLLTSAVLPTAVVH